MLKRTSILGKVEDHTADTIVALLYDFDIDGSSLKPHHLHWLETKVIALLRGKQGEWIVWLQGMASRPGEAQHNFILSCHREKQVLDYLRPRLAGVTVTFQSHPVGECWAARAGKPEYFEDPTDRAVWVVVQEKGPRPQPPPTYRWRQIPLPDKYFKIRMGRMTTLGASVSVFSACKAFTAFEFVDLEARKKHVFNLAPTGDYTPAGPWNFKWFPRDISPRDFEGPMQMLSVAATPASRNRLSFGSKWLGLRSRFKIPDFQTGNTIALPALSGTTMTGLLRYSRTDCYEGD
jgi:hypothetical protein